ncbi:MAG: cupin domain-containing protein, partial [Verrucomicrobiota bacterium]
MPDTPRRFVSIADAVREPNAWTNNEWLCRPDIVAADKLLLVRANMAGMHCHPFHFHPHREEIIYVIYGR